MGVEHALVTVSCGDDDEIIGTDIRSGRALIAAGIRSLCCAVKKCHWLSCPE